MKDKLKKFKQNFVQNNNKLPFISLFKLQILFIRKKCSKSEKKCLPKIMKYIFSFFCRPKTIY